MVEGIVGGDEILVVVVIFYYGWGCVGGECIGVVVVVNVVFCVGFVGEIGVGWVCVYGDDFFFGCELLYGKVDGWVGEVGDYVDMILVDLLVCCGGGDVCFVLVVGGDYFDFFVENCVVEIFDCYFYSCNCVFVVEVGGIDVWYVIENVDFYYVVGNVIGECWSCCKGNYCCVYVVI